MRMSLWASLSGRQLLLSAVVTVLMSCSPTVDNLGFTKQQAGSGAGAGGAGAGGAGAGGTFASVTSDGRVTTVLRPTACPTQYRNPYRELLGKSEFEILNHVLEGFLRLFHGNIETEAIYFEEGGDQATIRDILHDRQIRTEGMGIGMLVAVMLSRRDEFDKLWHYVGAKLQYEDEPLKGYFRSRCDEAADSASANSNTEECADPYGFQQILMALLLAREKFAVRDVDYGAEAVRLFDVLRNKEIDQRRTALAAAGGASGGPTSPRGGAADSSPGQAGAASVGTSSGAATSADIISNLFDEETRLVYVDPSAKRNRVTATAFLMPGYYSVWAQVTGDAYYSEAADAGREFLAKIAHPQTGLIPVRATFEGAPAEQGWGEFSPEAYRALINLVIDQVWGLPDGQWSAGQVRRLLDFFKIQGLSDYRTSYKLNGSTDDLNHPQELVLVNGVLAAFSNLSAADKKTFVDAAWGVPAVPANPGGTAGLTRYYHGILYLLSNLILSGQFRLC